ncbi:aspartate phosphatase, partial [Bacillus spizizenii]|nr:aspartate phosphatase [Bacillus spizizenii]
SYKAHENYTVIVIQCSFVIGLNCLDMDFPEKAIPHFKDALDKAREIDMSRLIGSSLYNLGLCSFAEEAYEKAAEYFKEG